MFQEEAATVLKTDFILFLNSGGSNNVVNLCCILIVID